MEYAEAIAVRKRQIAGQPVERDQVQIADKVIAATRALMADYGFEVPRESAPAVVQHRIADKPAAQPPHRPARAPSLMGSVAPPMDCGCECGQRYGAHRIHNYACPNPKWRCGNGEPQWLERNWKRA